MLLTTHPQWNEFLGYLGGVRLSEFIDPESAGIFQPGIFEGLQFKGADATPIELPNHVPASHDGLVNTEIEFLVQKGSLVLWSTVADTKAHLRPLICLPLGVEPNKPRLIWDARYPNLYRYALPFPNGRNRHSLPMLLGTQQVTLDHRSGLHNVPLAPESWKCFGLCWRGV